MPLFSLCGLAALAIESEVKAAVINFQPHFKQVSSNVDRLLQLAEEAGSNGTKIVIFPEWLHQDIPI